MWSSRLNNPLRNLPHSAVVETVYLCRLKVMRQHDLCHTAGNIKTCLFIHVLLDSTEDNRCQEGWVKLASQVKPNKEKGRFIITDIPFQELDQLDWRKTADRYCVILCQSVSQIHSPPDVFFCDWHFSVMDLVFFCDWCFFLNICFFSVIDFVFLWLIMFLSVIGVISLICVFFCDWFWFFCDCGFIDLFLWLIFLLWLIYFFCDWSFSVIDVFLLNYDVSVLWKRHGKRYLNYVYYHKCIISFVFLNFKWLLWGHKSCKNVGL